jgi:hypothetical protein
MLIRRSLSGKHILIWIGALLAIAIALLLGSWLLRVLVRHPTLGLAEVRAKSLLRSGAATGLQTAENRAQGAEHFRAALAQVIAMEHRELSQQRAASWRQAQQHFTSIALAPRALQQRGLFQLVD